MTGCLFTARFSSAPTSIYPGLVPPFCPAAYTVEKGQSIEIDCTNTKWTIDTHNYPMVSADGYKKSQFNYKYLSKLPRPDEPPGSLLAKVGMDPTIYYVGTHRSLISNGYGYIYLQINDAEEALFDNSGEAKCELTVFRPQIYENLPHIFPLFSISKN